MKSLRWRIVILLISLVCGVLFLTSSIIDYTLNRSFQHYLSEFHRQRREEMINTLTRIHQVAESWEEFFKLPSAPLILRSAGVVRLTDEDGRTLFLREELNPEAQSFLPQQNLRRLRRPRRPLVSVPLYIDDQLVGTAWIMAAQPGQFPAGEDPPPSAAPFSSPRYSLASRGDWPVGGVLTQPRRTDRGTALGRWRPEP